MHNREVISRTLSASDTLGMLQHLCSTRLKYYYHHIKLQEFSEKKKKKKTDLILHLFWKLMSPRCITRGKELLSNRFSLCQRAGAEFGDTAIFIDNGRGPEEKKNISAFFL